jgi:tRNA(fMet)-specific endonuclease VapC
MNGRYLLDTNVIIAFFAGEGRVRAGLDEADEVFLSSTAIGELYYGARKSSKPDENLARQHELTLVTRDTHFEQIDDLNATTW